MGGSDDGTKTKSVFLRGDLQHKDFFVCVETDDSLDICGLRTGTYVVFELHANNNGGRDPRNLRLAIDDEIAAYMPRCEPRVNSVKTRTSTCSAASSSNFKRDVVYLNKIVRFPSRILRRCPQVRTLMFEIPFGSPAYAIPVSALRVFSSH